MLAVFPGANRRPLAADSLCSSEYKRVFVHFRIPVQMYEVTSARMHKSTGPGSSLDEFVDSRTFAYLVCLMP
jgi:hypothetical protein